MIVPKIEFIYFDLGNVVVHFDHQIGCENLARLTGISATQANEFIFGSGLQTKFECGLIDADQFTRRFNALAGVDIDQQQLILAISNVFCLNRQIVPLITQLASAGFPIGVLSNTCSAHWNFILDRFSLVEHFFKPEFRILSYESSSMKPGEKIYADAKAAVGINAENIFFTDDRQDNVAAARLAGFQAEPFIDAKTMINCLVERNVKVNL